MTIPLFVLFGLLFTHWIADFELQSDQMAKNKSKSIKWLSLHVLVYTLVFMLWGVQFALISGALHWITDFFTSKITSYLYRMDDIHNFFVVIGFDQLVHMICLVYIWTLLN